MSPARSVCDWKLERARLLLAICIHIEARMHSGFSAAREIRRAAARWNGKPLRKNPERKLKLSPATLTRLFYEYKRRGASALELRYRGPSSKVPGEMVRRFIEQCLESATTTRAEAIRVMRLGKGGAFSVDSFYRSLPKAMRTKLGALHRLRQRAWTLEQTIRKGLL